jgi:hypothetical protein
LIGKNKNGFTFIFFMAQFVMQDYQHLVSDALTVQAPSVMQLLLQNPPLCSSTKVATFLIRLCREGKLGQDDAL